MYTNQHPKFYSKILKEVHKLKQYKSSRKVRRGKWYPGNL